VKILYRLLKLKFNKAKNHSSNSIPAPRNVPINVSDFNPNESESSILLDPDPNNGFKYELLKRIADQPLQE
jgi:hypothetical protein